MASHPENSPEINELMEEISKEDTTEVWCKGCQAFRQMNAKYARIIGTGEIESCGKCRK